MTTDTLTKVLVTRTTTWACWMWPQFYQSRSWSTGRGRILMIDCEHPTKDHRPLCWRCADEFHKIISDVSALVGELEIARTGQATFLELGTPAEADPDEAAVPWNERASLAYKGLMIAFGGPPVRAAADLLSNWLTTLRHPDLAERAARISAAVGVARAVIDSPRPKVYYGPCPSCSKDIYQERVGEGELVTCPCGYKAVRADHLKSELSIMADREFTLTKIIQVLCDGGEPTTRQEVENLIYRANGDLPPLPRDLRSLPRWEGGKLVPHDVYVYRLGTVREFLAVKRGKEWRSRVVAFRSTSWRTL